MEIELSSTLTLIVEKHPFTDEYHGIDGGHGVFAVSGWCLIGWRWSRKFHMYGLILLNRFVGLWSHKWLRTSGE